jgi:GTP-binding protein
MSYTPIRNVAIIAHVDHGKTTLVDQLLRQTGIFRENQELTERVMDRNDLERERGITIFSKNATVHYKNTRINIVDTPGHADFGGQVERILGTVDCVLLIVDAFEGPMAQTRFVTQKALSLGLKPIVVINKIDRPGCDPHAALDKVFDLFCDLHANEQQLEFPHIFAAGRNGTCRLHMEDPDSNLVPLLDMIVKYVPEPKGSLDEKAILQVSSLEYSEYLGRLAVGRLETGSLKVGQTIHQSMADGSIRKVRIQKLLHYEGVQLSECDEANYGEIICIAGLPDFDIGDTISSGDKPVIKPRITIDPPTISMNFCVNDSPLAGKSGGKYLTGNHLQDRLKRAQMGDPALRVENTDLPGTYKVSGRGVLHLTILIENMRRELYEFGVGAPQVIYQRDEKDNLLEPIETFIVTTPQEYAGSIIEELGKRKGEMVQMDHEGSQNRIEYRIPSRSLIGLRPLLLSLSKGYAITQSLFYAYEPYKGEISRRASGVLISKDSGVSVAYALWKLEDRGTMFIPAGREVYPGMIIGECNRNEDIVVNINKSKQLTNIRASGSDDNIQLTPHREQSLEEAITFINDDEMVEITPTALRVRKQFLDEHKRKQIRNQASALA